MCFKKANSLIKSRFCGYFQRPKYLKDKILFREKSPWNDCDRQFATTGLCNCVVITSLKDFNALQWRLFFFLQHWYLITTSLRYFRLKCKNVLLKNQCTYCKIIKIRIRNLQIVRSKISFEIFCNEILTPICATLTRINWHRDMQ